MRADDDDRAPGMVRAVLAHRAQQRIGERAVAMAADDEQVGAGRGVGKDLKSASSTTTGAQPNPPTRIGYCQAMTALITSPVSSASLTAQRSASSADRDPSTPTVM